ncbi:MAG: hypothetical protein QNK37_20680 [Acidobacteriota bacterium]|nr:hypothetical protein [Acidobacteriota bacterium]
MPKPKKQKVLTRAEIEKPEVRIIDIGNGAAVAVRGLDIFKLFEFQEVLKDFLPDQPMTQVYQVGEKPPPQADEETAYYEKLKQNPAAVRRILALALCDEAGNWLYLKGEECNIALPGESAIEILNHFLELNAGIFAAGEP